VNEKDGYYSAYWTPKLAHAMFERVDQQLYLELNVDVHISFLRLRTAVSAFLKDCLIRSWLLYCSAPNRRTFDGLSVFL
jgi:hypothetical protein